MRKALPVKFESRRIRNGPLGSEPGVMYGAFKIIGPETRMLKIISSGVDSEYGWEHVSVSSEYHIPNWREMCWVKDQFWDEEEWVVQFHPPKSEYVNCHPNCLHLWKPVSFAFPVPPAHLVGPKGSNDEGS